MHVITNINRKMIKIEKYTYKMDQFWSFFRLIFLIRYTITTITGMIRATITTITNTISTISRRGLVDDRDYGYPPYFLGDSLGIRRRSIAIISMFMVCVYSYEVIAWVWYVGPILIVAEPYRNSLRANTP